MKATCRKVVVFFRLVTHEAGFVPETQCDRKTCVALGFFLLFAVLFGKTSEVQMQIDIFVLPQLSQIAYLSYRLFW